MHPFIKNVRTSSIRVIVTSLYIALVLCAINFIGVGMAPASGVNISVDFNSNVTNGTAPLTVVFTGVSENATEWQWDFGDGSTSDVKDPSHTYFVPGSYNVTLMVSGMNETVTESKENYILVLQPTYSVYSSVINGTANVVVDKSTVKEGETVTVTISGILGPAAAEQERRSSWLMLLTIVGLMALGVMGYRYKDNLGKAITQFGNPDGKRYRRFRR